MKKLWAVSLLFLNASVSAQAPSFAMMTGGLYASATHKTSHAPAETVRELTPNAGRLPPDIAAQAKALSGSNQRIALALIDADTMLLPDIIVLPLMWLGLLIAASGYGFISLENSVFGAVAGYLFLWFFREAFRIATGKIGLGNGDMKLLAAGGAWLGWMSLLDVVLISSVAGAAFGIFQILSKRMSREAVMPFGPFLAMAIGITGFLHIQP